MTGGPYSVTPEPEFGPDGGALTGSEPAPQQQPGTWPGGAGRQAGGGAAGTVGVVLGIVVLVLTGLNRLLSAQLSAAQEPNALLDQVFDAISVLGMVAVAGIVPIAVVVICGHLALARSRGRGRARAGAALAIGYVLLAHWLVRVVAAGLTGSDDIGFFEQFFWWA